MKKKKIKELVAQNYTKEIFYFSERNKNEQFDRLCEEECIEAIDSYCKIVLKFNCRTKMLKKAYEECDRLEIKAQE